MTATQIMSMSRLKRENERKLKAKNDIKKADIFDYFEGFQSTSLKRGKKWQIRSVVEETV